jgi:hypothetical protein
MHRSLLIALLIVALAAALFVSCRSGGEDETTPAPSSDDDDNDDNDTGDDDDDNDSADDDTADDDTAADDDASPTGTQLAGEIDLFNTAEDYAGRPVKFYLYTQWIPNGTLPTAITNYTVPESGFPFSYDWDLNAVAPGDYYVFAFLDAVDGDGIINYDIDPVAAPYDVTTITSGETTTYNVNLVAPGK